MQLIAFTSLILSRRKKIIKTRQNASHWSKLNVIFFDPVQHIRIVMIKLKYRWRLSKTSIYRSKRIHNIIENWVWISWQKKFRISIILMPFRSILMMVTLCATCAYHTLNWIAKIKNKMLKWWNAYRHLAKVIQNANSRASHSTECGWCGCVCVCCCWLFKSKWYKFDASAMLISAFPNRWP